MPPFLSRILYVEEIEIQSIEPSSILTGQNTMCCDSVGLQVAGRSAFEEEVSDQLPQQLHSSGCCDLGW